MAACAPLLDPAYGRILTQLKSLRQKWAPECARGDQKDPAQLKAIIAADYHATRAKTCFLALEALLTKTGKPMEAWPTKLIHAYYRLKQRAIQTIKTRIRILTCISKTSTTPTAASALQRAEPSPAKTPPSTAAVPKRP